MGWNDVKVTHFKRPEAPGFGGYDSYESFSAKQKTEFKKWYDMTYAGKSENWTNYNEVKYAPEDDYDDRYSRMVNFFESIRTGKPVLEDATFGLRAAGPSIAANLSADWRKAVNWDPVKMKVIKKPASN